MKLEVPYSPELAEAVLLAAGGTILAGQLALRDGFAGIYRRLHHAYADHGEGFCALNDVAIANRRLQHDKLMKKAIVVDTDVHHGNGTAHIFRNDDSVSLFPFTSNTTTRPTSRPQSGFASRRTA